MDVFLGRESFPGPSDPAPARAGLYAGQAMFNGCIAFCNWDRDALAAALPAELELAVHVTGTALAHPVAIVFGEQTRGATIFAGITFSMGVDYHELAFAIPFVKHRRGRNLHTFVPRMFSSFFPATWAGNAHYGFGKVMATMRIQGAGYDVETRDGSRAVRAVSEPAGEWRPGASCRLANFPGMRAIFSLPIVGRRDDGTYVRSYFDWDFLAAQVRATRVAFAIEREVAPGIAPCSRHTVAEGAFEVRGMAWRLSWPLRCAF